MASAVKKPAIIDVANFVQPEHDAEVRQRMAEIQKLDDDIVAQTKQRKDEIAALKELIWRNAMARKLELERLTGEVIKQELQRADDVTRLQAAVETAERDFQLFVNKVIPAIEALEAKEAKRQAEEEAERRV